MSVVKNRALKQLLWIGMGSIAMFFAGLTSAYIVRKAEGNWTDFILPEWFWYSTITIVISSVVLIFSKPAFLFSHFF
jgi:cytochrome c oxidase subunit 3